MTTYSPTQHLDDGLQPLFDIFAQQKQQYSHYPSPTYQVRVSQLKALKTAVLHYKEDLVSAMSADFGYRSEHDSLIGDILPVVSHINYTLKKLKKWMKPSKRHAGLLLAPASVRVEYQPKGVVGIIAPWNFPIMLSLSPLVTSIAAGNRTMIKVSEFTPETNKVLTSLVNSIFSEQEVAIIEGEAETARAFTTLPFDHILFTGSTPVGKHVMRAAADNLTPVTLELGGKSPVIIGEDMPIETAVERLIYGKCLNAGQICVSPDYTLCPKNKVDEFIAAYRAKFQQLYPDFENNKDYSQIINTRQAERIESVLEDALAKGAIIHSANTHEITKTPLNGQNPKLLDTGSKKWPTQIISNVNSDMRVMQEEIFGPLFPIVPYESLSEAINFVKSNPRPLALYLMSYNKSVQRQVLEQTHSGGVCINETVFHVAAEDAPFGGIGPSGIGHYHGIEGFKTLSHAKTVLQRGTFNSGKLIHPPYGGLVQKLILKIFLR
ncbi:coniferyl aldehyde dehydrogenase [Vibrio algarum]|uniref:Aldehyde dehydrogenase n=1 Tax=Vibrio algarum TaxID=3020714 RepID=A0ABT4YPQ2_9VIBR|nr:coniferyl aldehyde dehydrogenase [Vibrio sp. KJ40-1]MDB1123529.1 coniferyl aldehyde dehydrogenase [Vibrio sp. KJ40-1]